MELVETLTANTPVGPTPALFAIEEAGVVQYLEMMTDRRLGQGDMIFEVACTQSLAGSGDQQEHGQSM